MDTKLKGDIAEQAAILEALNRGWGAMKPEVMVDAQEPDIKSLTYQVISNILE